MPSTRRPLWFRLLRIAALVYLGLVIAMMFLERSLIFHPLVYPDGDWQPRNLRFEDANFVAADGVKLHAWYLPHDKPRAVVLFAHGNAGNLSNRADLARVLHDRLGVSLLMFDYRGFGRSEGSPDEAGILADARASRKWLADRAGVPESQIVLMGESLGGGAVVDLAANDGARGLVLINTFSSLPDVAAPLYPWLPVRLLMRTRLSSVAKIGNYRGPLLQIHGDGDTIVPYASARRLFDAANPPKKLLTIPGGDHNDPTTNEAFAAVDEFIGSL